MLVKLEGTGYGGGVLRTNFIGRCSKITDLKDKIVKELLPSWSQEDFYVEYNGKVLREDGEVAALFGEVGVGNASKRVSIVPRVLGGKGGFGSMLRAIGAQIEKTTNRDACRDLSGRRLRDIDEQKRLVKWFEKQAKREIERREARERRLEKLRKVAAGPPLPKIEDQQFLQQRQEIMDAGFDAVDEAFRDGPSETDALATHKDSSNSTSPSTSNLQSLLETGPGKETRMCASASTNEYATGSASITNVKEPKPVKKTLFDEDLESDGTSSEDSEEDKR